MLDYWKFFAGIALFLLGMHHVESSLKELAGRNFKKFLKKYTTNRLLAIFNGTLVTALLQSSSLVMLMVIAFAGAGVLSLSNSLGLILGANLGTTFTGWLVSWLGFSADLSQLVLPLIAIGGIGFISISSKFRFHSVFIFLLGFAFLLLGLSYMKEGMLQLTQVIDIEKLNSYGFIAFLGFGFFVTALIQSSSMMMTLTLSALHASLIPLPSAVFVILGAELGTTMTALIASIHGSSIKKRVGLAHFLFNFCTSILGLFIFSPLLLLIKNQLDIENPLYLLVAFHSSLNVIGILLFVPFLGQFETLLNRFYSSERNRMSEFIHKVGPEVPEASLDALHKEADLFLKKVFVFNSSALGFQFPGFTETKNAASLFLENFIKVGFSEQSYKELKMIETEALDYMAVLQSQTLEKNESLQLAGYLQIFRLGVQSAKSLKDIQHNIAEYKQSVIEQDEKFLYELLNGYRKVHSLFASLVQNVSMESNTASALNSAQMENERVHETINKWIYDSASELGDFETKIATFLNVNREIYISNQSFIQGLREASHEKNEI